MFVALGLLLLGVPEHHEGRTLFDVPDNFARPLPINTGTRHGFTLANGFAAVTLSTGGLLLVAGMWRHRAAVALSLQSRPLAVKFFMVQLVVGAVLICVSGTSTALRWWAPGTLLFVLALVGLALLVWQTLELQPET